MASSEELARQAADQPDGRGEIIAATTTTTALTVRCELDPRSYPKGTKVTDQERASLNITGDTVHPEWNDTIAPRSPT